ncbi:MAG TPA: DUF2782 domain-containing protein, partial [Casimicrobiaceae bacterium]|nr:DUF2782 domain-containing protein [Casimicrobiaceae bacterium]
MIARTLLMSLAVAVAAGSTSAQEPGKAPPPPPLPATSTAPSPAPPPIPPQDATGDADLAPQVTIIRRDQQVIEEVRVHGELRYIRVTPLHGRPYYLIPDVNGATYIRRDSLD